MKILHYIPYYPCTSETFIRNLIVGLQQTGHDNYILTNKIVNDLSATDEIPLKEIDINRNFVYRALKKILSYFGIALLSNKQKIHSYIKEVSPDVIHCHFGWSGADIFNITNGNADKYVVSLHGQDVMVSPFKNKAYRQTISKMGKATNVNFTTPSHFLKSLAVITFTIPAEKIKVVGNVLNSRFYEHAINPHVASKENPAKRIYCIGRLVDWKGQDILIRALKVMNEKSSIKAKVYLIGAGEKELELKALVQSLGLTHLVYFEGAIPPNKVPAMLQNADLYIQPSRTDTFTGQVESFGVAVLEAISSNLPVIGSNSGGIPEILFCQDREQGISLVVPGDPEALATEITFYLENNITLSDTARSNILNKFSKKNVISEVISCY